MSKFHTLTVKEVKQETPDCVSVAFEVPSNLAPAYHFIQGQYLTLRTFINGIDVRRSYSICTSPQDEDLRVAIKKVEGGQFSTFANEVLKTGDHLEVMTPMGKFNTPIQKDHAKHYVAFAAGSGITPVLSILKTVLQSEAQSTFTLFYGNKGFESIIFREAIEDLKNKYMNRLSVHHILSREHLGSPLFYGRIDGEKCQSFCNLLIDPNTVDEFFLCGPEEMIHDVSDHLKTIGVDKSKIHFELFTSPLGKLSGKNKKSTKETPAFDSKIQIILDGNTFDILVKSDGDNILDTALKNGADLPFACKGGVCCTCKAKIMEGAVEMEVNYGLEEDEIAAGYVLTCQAHPTTDKVVVNFDV